MPFKHWSCYSPTSSQARVLVVQASVPAYLQDLPLRFFPTICTTLENEKITTDELRMRTTFQRVRNQEFFFGSRVAAFSEDPVEVLAPMSHFLQGINMREQYRKRTTLCSESSTIKGLLYAPDPKKLQERDAE